MGVSLHMEVGVIWSAWVGARIWGGEVKKGDTGQGQSVEDFHVRLGQQNVPEGYGMSTPVTELGCGMCVSVSPCLLDTGQPSVGDCHPKKLCSIWTLFTLLLTTWDLSLKFYLAVVRQWRPQGICVCYLDGRRGRVQNQLQNLYFREKAWPSSRSQAGL